MLRSWSLPADLTASIYTSIFTHNSYSSPKELGTTSETTFNTNNFQRTRCSTFHKLRDFPLVWIPWYIKQFEFTVKFIHILNIYKCLLPYSLESDESCGLVTTVVSTLWTLRFQVWLTQRFICVRHRVSSDGRWLELSTHHTEKILGLQRSLPTSSTFTFPLLWILWWLLKADLW